MHDVFLIMNQIEESDRTATEFVERVSALQECLHSINDLLEHLGVGLGVEVKPVGGPFFGVECAEYIIHLCELEIGVDYKFIAYFRLFYLLCLIDNEIKK